MLAGLAAVFHGGVVADRAVAAGHGDGRAEMHPDVFEDVRQRLANEHHVRAVLAGEFVHPEMFGDLAAALGFEGIDFDVVHGLSFL